MFWCLRSSLFRALPRRTRRWSSLRSRSHSLRRSSRIQVGSTCALLDGSLLGRTVRGDSQSLSPLRPSRECSRKSKTWSLTLPSRCARVSFVVCGCWWGGCLCWYDWSYDWRLSLQLISLNWKLINSHARRYAHLPDTRTISPLEFFNQLAELSLIDTIYIILSFLPPLLSFPCRLASSIDFFFYIIKTHLCKKESKPSSL